MGIPRTRGVNKPWQPLGIPSAITPIGQLHQSPPSPIPGILGRGPSHQSHVLEHRDTYGQDQVCSKGHQGLSVDRPCQPSFHWIKFWHVCFSRSCALSRARTDAHSHRMYRLSIVLSHTISDTQTHTHTKILCVLERRNILCVHTH